MKKFFYFILTLVLLCACNKNLIVLEHVQGDENPVISEVVESYLHMYFESDSSISLTSDINDCKIVYEPIEGLTDTINYQTTCKSLTCYNDSNVVLYEYVLDSLNSELIIYSSLFGKTNNKEIVKVKGQYDKENKRINSTDEEYYTLEGGLLYKSKSTYKNGNEENMEYKEYFLNGNLHTHFKKDSQNTLYETYVKEGYMTSKEIHNDTDNTTESWKYYANGNIKYHSLTNFNTGNSQEEHYRENGERYYPWEDFFVKYDNCLTFKTDYSTTDYFTKENQYVWLVLQPNSTSNVSRGSAHVVIREARNRLVCEGRYDYEFRDKNIVLLNGHNVTKALRSTTTFYANVDVPVMISEDEMHFFGPFLDSGKTSGYYLKDNSWLSNSSREWLRGIY